AGGPAAREGARVPALDRRRADLTAYARAVRSSLAPALVPALALALAACDAPDRGPRYRPAGATTPQAGGTLRFSTKDALTTLDPVFAQDEVSQWTLHALVDTLVDFEPGGTRLIPRLAERWELSPDGRTYRFWLREGLRYADGAA